jgi:tetratricopeptide (TPR) repeat protein
LAPENPRVLLLDAISLYNTPERWGGDKDKAIEQLHAALDQFEDAAPSDPLAPQWGHADAYAWLGIAHLEAGRHAQARKALQQALDTRPGYAWVETVLLPKVASAQ